MLLNLGKTLEEKMIFNVKTNQHSLFRVKTCQLTNFS